MAATLLVVEDDLEIRTGLALYLGRLGYVVREAADGRTGLDAFLREGADVILLDVLLPKLDGRGFLRELRAHPAGRTVPVVVMSAVYKEMAFRQEEAASLGISGFLTKPFQLRQVAKLVRGALGEVSAVRPLPVGAVEAPVAGRVLEASRDPVPTSGDLFMRPLADVLPALAIEAFSGRVTLSAGEVTKQIVLRNGVPVFAASSVREETLGLHLVRAGILDEERLETLRNLGSQRGAKLGEVLLSEGILGPHDLYTRIRDHMVEKVIRAFAWSEGRFELAAGDQHAHRLTLAPMDIAELVIAGVQQHMRDSEILRHLPAGGDDHPFVRPDAAYSTDALPLGPAVHRVLQLASRGSSLGEIARTMRRSLELLRRDLFVLYVLRVVGVRTGPAAVRPAATPSAPPPRRETFAGALPRSTPIPSRLGGSLLEHYLRTKGKDHFAVLGIERSASESEVGEAHARWRARLDPATLGREVAGEMRDRAEELLQAIDEAFETLSDGNRRAEYERSLAPGVAAGRDPVIEAERDLKEARRLLQTGHAREAVETLRRLRARAPSDPTYAAELALALLLSDPERHHAEILGLATRARKGSPDLATPYFVLAKLALADGDLLRAWKLFHRVLDCDPAHIETKREIRSLAKRLPK